MSFLARFLKIATLASAAALTACGGGGGGGGGGGPVTDAGTIKVALTDAAACGYNQINVSVLKVRFHTSATAADSDPGWWETPPFTPAQKVNLLALSNGFVLELGQVQVPVGTYQQLAIVLDASTPLANSVVPIAGTETALAMPATPQSIVKIPVSITVTKDQTSDYVVDFDACNSVLRLGASGSYKLSARLSVIQRLPGNGQRVTGYVATSLDPTTTRVSVQQNGTIVKATNPDSTGHFILYPVPTGTYDLVVGALGAVPAVVTGVPVTAAASTDVNTNATPINPPGSPSHTITGTVNTGTTPVDARVTIIKKYTGGPNVITAGAPADATTGGLAYTVPTAAPVRAPYVAGINPLVFSPDNAQPTGRYTVSVTAMGTTKTADVDATTNDPVVSFTFP